MNTNVLTAPPSTGAPGKAKNIALWTAQILVAAAFVMAGFAKLSGQPMMVQVFDGVGLGQWLRYVTGSSELIAAVLVVIPRFASAGAALLVATMSGAVVAHLTALGGSPVAPIVLGLLAAVVAWGRWSRLSIAR